MMQRIRTALDGSGPYVWAAFGFALLGALILIAQLESPDLVIWTGHCIPATEQGGLVFYKVNGQTFSIDDVNAPPTSPTRTVSVCYDAGNPEQATLVHPAAYWFEGSLIGLPFLTAVVILIAGLVIVPRRMRRRQERLRL